MKTAGGTSNGETYTYVTPAPVLTLISPSQGVTAGGTAVTLTGTNLAGATAVDFGTVAGTITADTATSITVTSPAVTATGSVSVTVVTPGGTSNAESFTYVTTPPPAPAITAVSPTSGTTAGGTAVTITGTNLAAATAVDFGTDSRHRHRGHRHVDHRDQPGTYRRSCQRDRDDRRWHEQR